VGWSFRKGIKIGPIRVNLSKRGVGASVGVRGARVGINAAGRAYGQVGRGGLAYRWQQSGGRRGGRALAELEQPERRWFVSCNGETTGPIPENVVWWWATTGQLRPGTSVAAEDGGGWHSLEWSQFSMGRRPMSGAEKLLIAVVVAAPVVLVATFLFVACG
jgi:hypothetical protein